MNQGQGWNRSRIEQRQRLCSSLVLFCSTAILLQLVGQLPSPTHAFSLALQNNKAKSRIPFVSNIAPQTFLVKQAPGSPLFARRAANPDDDIPADWSEDDILSEFEDMDGGSGQQTTDDDEDIEEEDETLVTFEDEDISEEDDDEDDEDLDDIDLDEEDDEEEENLVVDGVDATAPPGWEGSYTPDPLDWDEEEDGGYYELEDDPDDPNYMKQKELVEATVEASKKQMEQESFDPMNFMMNDMTEEQSDLLEKFPFLNDIQAKAREMMLTESDVDADMDVKSAVGATPEFMTDDEYPPHGSGEPNMLERNIGMTDDDMQKLDEAYRMARNSMDEERWDKVMVRDMEGFSNLSNETVDEIGACLDELGGSAYNVTRWLLYDLDFNVSNLMLASIKHNPESPVLFHHWYPQLVTYSRYKDARMRDYDFSWEDVQNSDTSELQRYYQGFGYAEIPSKAPSETGIISFEDLDEEEIKMAAFESWMAEVYNPESDRKDFDDDDLQDTDNVFSEYYEHPQHPDKPSFDEVEEDLENWNEEFENEHDPEVLAYRDRMGQSFKYDVVHDDEFQKEFRGHLVVSCSADDADLEVAEKLTMRFQEEFGKQVWVETRIEELAREEDNVFEIWLESYEIDLLHSKKRANSSNKDWTGPAECDDAQIDNLVEQVRFLISDDARHSYRMEFEYAD